MKRLLFPLVIVMAISFGLAGEGSRKVAYESLPNETQPIDPNVRYTPAPEPDWSTMTTAVGTFTTLSGFYDYQSNGGAVQHIRVNPANGNIHVVYMTSADSTPSGLNPGRRVAYAFSSDGGVTWASTLVLPTRAGFPTIDLLKGTAAGLPIVASHPDGAPTIAKLFADSPEGALQFSELTVPPVLGQTLEPIWPFVASASDGSMIVAASQNNTTTNTGIGHHNRLQNDFFTWNATWDVFPGDSVQSGGRYPVQANGTGRVGILWNSSNGTAVLGNRWRESTDNGATWSTLTNVFGQRSAGVDTLNAYVHCDFVYDGNNPLMVFSEYKLIGGANLGDADIVFWSQATGFVVIAPFDSTKYRVDPVNQRFHRDSHGWPSIGLSGSTIVVAYQGFQPETDRLAYHYSDLWYVASSNGGVSWGQPQRITNTPTTDERYPSVSKWNASGQFNMTWSQKEGASGLYAFPGGADTVRASQVFLRVNPIQFTTSVEDENGGIPSSFRLSQNYPNPFNPSTTINYSVPKSANVRLVVYNALGQEVATLVDGYRNVGSYAAEFSAAHVASGVYFYTLTAGEFSSTRKMVLMK